MYYEIGRLFLLWLNLIRLSVINMSFQFAVITFFFALVSYANFSGATTTPIDLRVDDENQESVSSPLPPEYVIETDNSVSLRVCYNWSCASRQTMNFTPDDMELLKKRMAAQMRSR